MDTMFWIWTLIVGAVIGAIAGAITNNGHSMGWISNILAGLAGSALGQGLFGSWGPSLGGMAVVPSVLGCGHCGRHHQLHRHEGSRIAICRTQ